MQQQKQITVASVDSKSGQGAKGPWTMYKIKDTDGIEYTTFEQQYADIFTQGAVVDIVFTEKQNGQYLNRNLIVPQEYRSPRKQSGGGSIDLSKTNEILETISLSLAIIADYFQSQNVSGQVKSVKPTEPAGDPLPPVVQSREQE